MPDDLAFKPVSDCDRENMPDWSNFDESEARRLFAKAFVPGANAPSATKREVMRMCRSIILTAKDAKVGAYAG